MVTDSQCKGPKRFRIRTVEGTPLTVAGLELTPLARVMTFGRASGTLGTARSDGWGMGFNWFRPIAVLVGSDQDQERIQIPDATATAVMGMAGAAIFVMVFFAAVRIVARRLRIGCA